MARIISSEAVVKKALSQVGVSEHPHGSNRTPYTSWYGMVGPWCAMFVSWAFWHGGKPLPSIRTRKGFAYCPDIVNWAKANGCWRPKNSGYTPKRGDIILFDFIGRPSHVGIVVANLGGGRVQTVEGNTNGAGSRTGGSVMVHNRSISGSTIGFVDVKMEGNSAPRPPASPDVSSSNHPTLRRGSTGPYVRVAQTVLRDKAGQRITVDGSFGPATETAVKNLQRFFGVTADGVVGPQTWNLLSLINR